MHMTVDRSTSCASLALVLGLALSLQGCGVRQCTNKDMLGAEIIVYKKTPGKVTQVLMRHGNGVKLNAVGRLVKSCQRGVAHDHNKKNECGHDKEKVPGVEGLCKEKKSISEALMFAWKRAGLSMGSYPPASTFSKANEMSFDYYNQEDSIMSNGKPYTMRFKLRVFTYQLEDPTYTPIDSEIYQFRWMDCDMIRTKPKTNHDEMIEASGVCDDTALERQSVMKEAAMRLSDNKQTSLNSRSRQRRGTTKPPGGLAELGSYVGYNISTGQPKKSVYNRPWVWQGRRVETSRPARISPAQRTADVHVTRPDVGEPQVHVVVDPLGTESD